VSHANAMGKRRFGAAALALLAPIGAIACILHVSACKDDGTHVYIAQLYVEARGCLGTTSSVDVISGEAPGTCAPICLVQKRGDAGPATYVATMCPPYPSGVEFDTSGTDPSCTGALAALARNDICLTDGGSTSPVPPVKDAAAE
jgi:hypothetical protein